MLVELLAGAGPAYGTGHLKRMEELARLLKKRGIEYRFRVIWDEGSPLDSQYEAFHETTENRSPGEHERLWVIDARDLDPTFLSIAGPIIALDNRCKNRTRLIGSIQFVDTIPHPECDLLPTLDMSLIPGDIRKLTRNTHSRQKIFCYSGDWDTTDLDEWLSWAVVSGAVKSVLRCGSSPFRGDSTEIIQRDHLTREEYLAELADSTFLVTYFGMTMLEGWYLGLIPILFFPPSDTHGELTWDIHRIAGIPILLRKGDRLSLYPSNTLKSGFRIDSDFRPSGNGFDRLLDLIFSFIK